MGMQWFLCIVCGWQILAVLSFPLEARHSPLISGEVPRLVRSTHPGCPKGHYLDGYDERNEIKPDAVCRWCPVETFNRVGGNHSIKCATCRPTCDTERMVEVERCTRFSDRKCACRAGFKEARPPPDLVCVRDQSYSPMITCQPGQRIDQTGSEPRCVDCPQGTISLGNNSNCFPDPVTAASTDKEPSPWKTASIVLAVVLGSIILAFVVIFYVRRKWKCRRPSLAPRNGLMASNGTPVSNSNGIKHQNDRTVLLESPGVNGHMAMKDVQKKKECSGENSLNDDFEQNRDSNDNETQALIGPEPSIPPGESDQDESDGHFPISQNASPSHAMVITENGTSGLAPPQIGAVQIYNVNNMNFNMSHSHSVNTVVYQKYDITYELAKTEFDNLRQSNHVFYQIFDVLMENISIYHMFLAKLLAQVVISSGQNEEIVKPTNTPSDKVALLLGFVSKRDTDKLALFLVALSETHQEAAVDAIAQGLAAARNQCDDFVQVKQALMKLGEGDGPKYVLLCMEKAIE